jgi:RNA-directed DNA polymerase
MHMGKGAARMRRGEGRHRPDTEQARAMETKLTLIARKAKEERKCRFNNLMHLINVESLRECFYKLKRGKAPGIDFMTVEEYERNLVGNLEELMERMKRMSYRPQPVRRVYIPKVGGKQRALGVPAVEDKLVQMAFSRILEAVFEADFLDLSYGFRKGRSPHQALARVDRRLMHEPINVVLDADIKGFFDNVDQEWMKRFLEERISDRKFIRYILRMLRSGVMEEGVVIPTGRGTPQGGVISPLLANIYLHYVLDLWFYHRVRKRIRGYADMIRYCDDFIILVEEEADAREMLQWLEERLNKFGLELSERKTRIVRFGRKAWRDHGKGGPKPGTFNFLGFTHYCGKSRKGQFKVGRRTERKRFCQSMQKVKNWLKHNRSTLPRQELHRWIRVMLMGHYRYYGVSDNSRQLQCLYDKVRESYYKWLNRRSQKRSFTWASFERYLRRHSLPLPKIYHDLYHLAF